MVPISELCVHVHDTVDLASWPSAEFDYYEIGGVDTATGQARSRKTLVEEAPSRAKIAVKGGDLLVSTVRPNLKAVAQIHPSATEGVASSGFCVLRAESPEIGAFIRACLVHDAGTQQLMRWNAGGTYPAIENDAPTRVMLPGADTAETLRIGAMALQSMEDVAEAHKLVESAGADVEALLSNHLDEQALHREGAKMKRWLRENTVEVRSENE
jgi:type I restriction enzyme S subunit